MGPLAKQRGDVFEGSCARHLGTAPSPEYLGNCAKWSGVQRNATENNGVSRQSQVFDGTSWSTNMWGRTGLRIIFGIARGRSRTEEDGLVRESVLSCLGAAGPGPQMRMAAAFNKCIQGGHGHPADPPARSVHATRPARPAQSRPPDPPDSFTETL